MDRIRLVLRKTAARTFLLEARRTEQNLNQPQEEADPDEHHNDGE
jgi:hypothetical protein